MAITKTFYYIGNADESDTYYFETIMDNNKCFSSYKSAKKEIERMLKDWGEAEGYTTEDYDIAEVKFIITRKKV